MKYIYLPVLSLAIICSCSKKNKETSSTIPNAAASSMAQAAPVSKDDSLSKEVAQIAADAEPKGSESVVEEDAPRSKPSPAAKTEKKANKAKKAKAKKVAKKAKKTKAAKKVDVPKSNAPIVAEKGIKPSKPEIQTGGVLMYQKTNIGSVENTPIWKLTGTSTPVICFKTKLSIDVDGSPRAYGPKDMGLDYTQHAGKEGNWFGVVTQPNGLPLLQGAGSPNPGYYISTTALYNSDYAKDNPLRYVNSETVPYISLPKPVFNQGAQLGDMAYVYNTKTKRGCYAVIADRGPSDMIGEGSIYLAKQLGIHHTNVKDEESGWINPDILYMVFPNSGKGNGKHPSMLDINEVGEKYLDKVGGMKTVYGCALFK